MRGSSLIPVILLAITTLALQASEQRVLFIGNSLTHSGGAVEVAVRDFAAADGSSWTTVGRSPPGWSLRDHRNSQDTLDRINDPAGWDAVVLQDYSNRPMTDPAGFQADVAALSELIRAVGAQPVLYMTWAYRSDLDMTLPLARAYTQAGLEAGAWVAPVGLAWHRARLVGYAGRLFSDDKHQTTLGTYLAGAVLYGRIAGLDLRPNGHLGGHPADQAAELRAIAAETLADHETVPRNHAFPIDQTTAPLGHLAYLPIGYRSMTDRDFPLLVYLGGFGERGDGLEPGLTSQVLRHGPPKIIAGLDPAYPHGRHFPGLVLSPQQANTWDAEEIEAFIEHALTTWRVDPERVYLTGLSDGASGCWRVAERRPDLVAAIVPIAAAVGPADPHRLVGVDTWAFHNFLDPRRRYTQTTAAIAGIAGGWTQTTAIDPVEEGGYPHDGDDPERPASGTMTAHFLRQQSWQWQDGIALADPDVPGHQDNAVLVTLYPDDWHDAWSATYRQETLWRWLFSRTRSTLPAGPSLTPIVNGSVVQAEDYDIGAAGSAYVDQDPANNGGQYRSDGVDIESTRDIGGGYNLGWTAAGEWLHYSLQVEGAQALSPVLRVARAYGSPGGITLSIGDRAVAVAIPPSGGWQSWIDVSVPTLRLQPGVHTLRVAFDSSGTNLNHLRFELAPELDEQEPAPTHGNEGEPWVIAGGAIIEAEDYDIGGAGVAYADADTSNRGGKYRDDGVDIESTADAGGGYNIGWIEPGEWLVYTVVSETEQTLDLGLRVSRAYDSSGTVRIELGETVRSLPILQTGGWQAWDTVWLSDVPIPAGRHQLRIHLDSGGFNLNRIEFSDSGSDAAPTHGNAGLPWPLDALLRLEAENYDTDGPGVAYHDQNPENRGGKYREDGVDIERSADVDGGYNVGWIDSTEWLSFTVEGDQDAVYELRIRVARSYGSEGSISADIAGNAITAAVLHTGGWQAWTTQTVGLLDIPAGRHRLVLRFPSGGYNLNHLTLERVPSAAQ